MSQGFIFSGCGPTTITIPPGMGGIQLYLGHSRAINDHITHEPPRYGQSGHVCDYCRTVSAADRCPSCGAPRTANRSNR